MAMIYGTQYNDDDSFNGVFPDVWWRNKLHGTAFADSIYGKQGNDVAFGYGGNDVLYGDQGDDYLDGGIGDDILAGGTGNDRMYGGWGNDTYLVMDAGDQIFESIGAGTDTANVYINGYSLSSNVENLVLQEGTNYSSPYDTPTAFAAPRSANGNDLSNMITGNTIANTLRGMGGNDTIFGRSGHDTLYGGLGDDALYGELGRDNLQGEDGRDVLYGGADGDILLGGADNDVLDGGTGSDWMLGGTGNDSYYVDDAGDWVSEFSDAGIDTVYAAVTYTLPSAVENLFLSGSSALNGSGNALGNQIFGNSGNNTLDGKAGNDTLSGYGWRSGELDTLVGGAGSDRFELGNSQGCFYEGSGYATITDFDPRGAWLDLEFDRIQVTGAIRDYSLRSISLGGTATLDTGIYKGNDLIGVALDRSLVASRDLVAVPYSPLF